MKTRPVQLHIIVTKLMPLTIIVILGQQILLDLLLLKYDVLSMVIQVLLQFKQAISSMLKCREHVRHLIATSKVICLQHLTIRSQLTHLSL